MFHICCVHGFIRDIKFVQAGKTVFDCTADVRTAKIFETVKEAEFFMESTCKYYGHYCILKPVDVRDE